MDNHSTLNSNLRSKLRLTSVLSSVFICALALSGCDSSSNSAPEQPNGNNPTPEAPANTTATLSGTAAVGAAIVDGTVTARCADGSGFTQAITTDADGRWSGNISPTALPCALQVSGGTPPVTLHSYASSAGTINITPLTDLAMAMATSQSPADWFNNFDGSVVDIDTATTELLDSLATKGFTIPPQGNPFTTPFTANGTQWDGLLDDLGESITNDPSIADHNALVTLVKDGNLNSLPAAPAPDMFNISGSISGASADVSWQVLVADNVIENGTDSNGAVTFSPIGGITEGSAWNIEVTPPSGQTCNLTNGSGTLSADVTNVAISCSDIVIPTNFSISGNLSGATGSVTWELRRNGNVFNDGSNNNGGINFTSAMEENSNWAVTVTSSPAGQNCAVANGSGTLTNNISNVEISCSDIVVAPTTYSISGSIIGATSNVTWLLKENNVAFNSDTSSNGAITFTNAMNANSTWAVTVTTSPSGQTCEVTSGSGTLTANVTTVQINCSDIVTGGPSTPLYDLSSLNLDPAIPAGFSPVEPNAIAADPSDQIASLFAQLGEMQKEKIFATPPANLITEINNDVYDSSKLYYVTERTADNTWIRTISMDFGVDGEANTADDFIKNYTISPNGPQSVRYSYYHPGPDKIWFTEDDVLGDQAGNNAIYIPSSQLLEYQDASEGAVLILPCLTAGKDGLPFTADDQLGCSLGYQIAIIDGQGNRGQIITYKGFGADGLWFTADDVVNNYTLVSSALSGQQTISTLYNQPGSDGFWFTEDDVVSQHIQTQLDSSYLPRYGAIYNARGTDGVWFTADDQVLSWIYYGYDNEDQLAILATHSNKGLDGQWFTADDTATGLVNLKDAAGNTIISTTISGNNAMGADGIWLTGDETLYSYNYAEYDSNNYQTRSAIMNNKGADNAWFTADDLPQSYNYWQQTLDSQGRILSKIYYDASLNPSAPAFSASHASRYQVNNADMTLSVGAYRDSWGSSFGTDGIPLTADDVISQPYRIETATGFDLYNQAGPDGEWFTADDIKSGSLVIEYQGNREIASETYDATGTLIAYSETEDLTENSYKYSYYSANDSGGFDLLSYSIIETDAYGNPLWTSYYDAAGNFSYAIYTERDSSGRVIAEGYSSGTTSIDDLAVISTSTYNSSGELVASGDNRKGPDGIWGTGDDTSTVSYIYILNNDMDELSLNTGYSPAACGDLISGIGASGNIKVTVVDQNGAPLDNAIIQLNDNGTTSTTDTNGEAEFTGLSGTQDVHVFKDNYGWESFYCVAPGSNVNIQSQLVSLTENAYESKVSFSDNGDYKSFVLRLLDDNGKPISKHDRFGDIYTEASASYGYLYFNLPVGSEVTGNLWAFKVENGKLTSALNLGEQTYTTIATNSYSGFQTITLNFPTTTPTAVATAGFASVPTADYGKLQISVGNYLGIGSYYDNISYSNAFTLPGLDVDFPAEPSAVFYNSEYWKAWYPQSNLPQRGDTAEKVSINSGFMRQALMNSQTDNSGNPTISWIPAANKDDNDFITSTRLELLSAVGGLGYKSHWTIHTPAGENQITLPSLPTGITSGMLPHSSYQMVLETRGVVEMNYHEFVGNQNTNDLDVDIATEYFIYGDSFNGAKLTR